MTHGSHTSLLLIRSASRLRIDERICLFISYPACTGFSISGSGFLSASPQFCHMIVQEYQPVVHLLRSLPRIRSRLTLRRRSLLRNPYAFGGKDSHLSFRYSYQHSHFPQVHQSFQTSFTPVATLPYPVHLSTQPRLRFRTLAPEIFGAGTLD